MVNQCDKARKAARSTRQAASTTNAEKKTCLSSSKAKKSVSLSASQNKAPSHPKPRPAYKGATASTTTETHTGAAAAQPALADAIQRLLDLSGENPTAIVNPDDIEVLNSEGEPEVVKPCKRKRKGEDSGEEEDDE